MGKSAPRTQTITETSNEEPWAGAQPYILEALGAASGEFGAGAPAYYPGQTVAPMSDATVSGLNQIGQNAQLSPQLANQGLNWLGSVSGPRFNPGQWNIAGQAQGAASNPFLGTAGQISQGAVNPYSSSIVGASGSANPYASSFLPYASQQAQGAGTNALNFAATGGLAQANPYLDEYFSRGANAIRNEVDTAFNRAGRNVGGSANYGDALGRNLGNFATDLYGGAYDTGISRGMQAAGQLASYEQGGIDRQLGALGQQAGLYETQVGRNMGGLGQAADLYNTGIGQQLSAAGLGGQMYQGDLGQQLAAYQALASQGNTQAQQMLASVGQLQGLYDLGGQGGQDTLGVGAMLDQYNQQLVNADINAWNYNQNAPRSNIEWYNAIANGAGQLGGNTTTTGQQPYMPGNPFLQGLGAIGSIMSIFGASDRRLKDDIEELTDDPRGFKWYAFRYKWDAPETRRVGVMADEIEPIMPHAVAYLPSGYAMVDYGALL